MDGLSKLISVNSIALEGMWMRAEHWLLTRVFTSTTVEQVAVVLVALGLAWIIAKPLERRARTRVAQRSGWMEQSLKMLAYAAIQISFPLVAVLLLWAWVIVLRSIGSSQPLVGTVASLLTAWVVIRLVARVIRNETLSRFVALTAWSIAALNILDLLDPALSLLDRAAITLGQLRLSVLGLLKAVFALSVMLWVATITSRVIEQRLRVVGYFTPSAQVLVGKLVKTGFVGLAVLVALNTVGIDLTTLAVLTGAIGVGIGFGLQKVVSNLISGMLLLMDRSIKPGDVIEIGETFGWVSKLGARYAAVTTRDGIDWLIPNEDLITNRVTNWSYSNDLIRLKLPFGVSYDSDVRQAMTLAVEAARSQPRVLADPSPVCRFVNFGESALEMELRLWIRDPHNGIVNVRSDVLLAMWDRFRAAGVVVPFPQRDVHIRRDPEDAALRPEQEQRAAE